MTAHAISTPNAASPADGRSPAPLLFIPQPEALYSLDEIACALEVHPRTIKRRANGKDLPRGFKIGSKWYWKGDALIRHWDRRQRRATGEGV